MNTEVADATRRSALVLHALCDRDREWILHRLPAAKQERLRTLLMDLKELGIPSDRELLKPFAVPVQGRASAAVSGGEASARALCATVSRFDPERVALVLRDEPPQLIFGFVQLYDWPWRDAFIQHLDPLRRKQVLDLLAADAVKIPPPMERPAHTVLLNAIVAKVAAVDGRPLADLDGSNRHRGTRGWLGVAAAWLHGRGKR